jgi:hypothetical protein
MDTPLCSSRFGSSTTSLQNAFSTVLSKCGFDYHKMVTVDLLHNVEIGEGKKLLTHIVRIIEWLGVETVHKFDEQHVLHAHGHRLIPDTHIFPVFE